MLYNIISPLIFFGSLGGIIVIMARISLRRRRQNKTEAAIQEVNKKKSLSKAAFSLRPSGKRIQLATNQVALALQQVKQLSQDGRDLMKEKFQKKTQPSEAAQTIQLPEVSFREKTAARVRAMGSSLHTVFIIKLVGGIKNRLFGWREARRARREQIADSQVAVENPATETIPEAQSTRVHRPARANRPPVAGKRPPVKKRISAQVVSPTFFRQTPKPSPIIKAKEALGGQKYSEVENILVPYIIEHAKDVDAYLILGEASLAQENWREAMEIFEQVLKLNPAESQAQAHFGYAAYRSGQFGKALPALQRAVDADPANETILDALLYIARTMDNRALQHSIEEKRAALKAREKVGAP